MLERLVRIGVIITVNRRGQKMRHLLLLSAAALAMAAAVPRAQANPPPAPWCAVVSTGFENETWDCHYASIEECRPNVIAGNRGFCQPNPAYNGPVEPDDRYRWRARRR
jgi:hypothetical protein